MNADDLPSSDELAELLPQYRFEQLIAEGGMGAVYRAEQISLGRPVAIKILPRSFSADATYREQFKSEARLMGSLRHPHIVDIHDFGESGDVLYIVMELLEGTNLYQRMKQETVKQQEVVKILCQVCDALAAAHSKGVVHRDVKPENIFLEPGLRVKLGDFGIARLRRPETDRDLAAAEPLERLGTPEYAAPELFDLAKPIDHRADIFSLGVVLYEMLTGTRPTGTFIAPSHRRQSVDRRFDAVVVRAMQHEPQDRYANAEEMKKDLLRVLGSASQPAMRAPAAGKTPTGQKGARPAPAAATYMEVHSQRSLTTRKQKTNPVLLWSALGAAAAAAFILILVLTSGGTAAQKNDSAGDNTAKTERPDKVSRAGAPAPEPVVTSAPDSESSSPPPREPGPPAEKLVFAQHTYQFVPSRLTWEEAKTAAAEKGGCLACITSQAEYDALRAYLLPLLDEEDGWCWLGASDVETEGAWKWISGEPFEFAMWAPGAPSNGSDRSQGPQNHLAWQRQSKYGERRIEWNDLSGQSRGGTTSGSLIEWAQPAAGASPAVTSAPPALPSGPVRKPLTWPPSYLTSKNGRVTTEDGWYVFSSTATLEAPPDIAFTDGVVRARVRIGSAPGSLEFKPRYTKEDALICALEEPGQLRIFRRVAGDHTVLATWPLAERPQPGDELRLEMELIGKTLTMHCNGVHVGSVETGDICPSRVFRFMAHDVGLRDAEWLSLDGVTDPAKAIAGPSAWPLHGELAAALTSFSEKRTAAYGRKLDAELQKLREQYLKHLDTLAAKFPTGASILKAEAALAAAGDLPPADAPGTHTALVAPRKTWHDAKTRLEKEIAPAALALWKAHLAKLQSLESALRNARKFADAADVAPHRSEAETAVARFSTLANGKVVAK